MSETEKSCKVRVGVMKHAKKCMTKFNFTTITQLIETGRLFKTPCFERKRKHHSKLVENFTTLTLQLFLGSDLLINKIKSYSKKSCFLNFLLTLKLFEKSKKFSQQNQPKFSAKLSSIS